MKTPECCNTMEELRAEIDTLDRDLMRLLAERSRYIDRAAEIKTQEALPARIDWRVEQVAMNARKNASDFGFDPDLAERLWRELIEWSIAREDAVLDKTKQG